MSLPFFHVFLLLLAGCSCFNTSRRVMNSSLDLGYFLKSVDPDEYPEPRQNSIDPQPVKGGYRPKDALREKTIVIIVKPSDSVAAEVIEGRPKDIRIDRPVEPDDAVPLHVTNTARKQCLEGYQVDENGICQKSLAPKGDKSFKLRRRKRAEQGTPKLSYADVVKYGRNPPKNIGAVTNRAEVLTTTQKTIEAKKGTATPRGVVTTQPPPVILPKATTAVPVKTEGVVTTLPPQVKTGGAATTRPPQVKAASAAPAVKPTALPTTVKPSQAPSKGSATPPTRPPSRVSSVLGDINQAFLSGEKSSAVAQSMDGKIKPVPIDAKKAFDPTRLRRWVGLF